MDPLPRPFAPHPLVRGGNLQTIFGHLTANDQTLTPDETLTFTLDDGDEVAIDLNIPKRSNATTPVVLLVHGLSDSSDSSYNIRIAQKLRTLGFRTARYNHRGSGRHRKLKALGIYHSGSVGDLKAALLALDRRWPGAPLLVAGFSLSGTILLNLLGREPNLMNSVPGLKRALAVCPPIDLEASSQSISVPRHRLFDRYYTRRLVESIEARRAEFPNGRWPELPRRLNLRDFDEVVTAKLGGFRNRSEYYQRCSPANVVQNIRLPTLVVATADDPLIPINTVTRAPFSEDVTLRIEHSGGHMGFISRERTRFGDFRWLDDLVVSWAQSAWQEKRLGRIANI